MGYLLKPAPEGMHFPETQRDPLTTNHQDLQDILQPRTSALPPGNPLAEGMESRSCALDPLATQSHNWFLSGSKAKRYTSQLSFKIPKPAPKALYTAVPASKLLAAWGSPGTGAASEFGFPERGGSFSIPGTIPSELDGSKGRGGPEILFSAAFDAKATPSF